MNHIDNVREALTDVDDLLVVAGYHEDSSTRHQLSIALSALSAHEAEVKELVSALEQIMSLPMYVAANGWATVRLSTGMLIEARAILAKVKP